MARLSDIPREILKLIVDELLRSNHHSVILPLAQTYNKSLYDACSQTLQYRQNIPAKQLVIADIFLEDIRPGWLHSPLETEELLDVSYITFNGTLEWLDDLVRDAVIDDSVPSREFDQSNIPLMLQNLISFLEILGCELPNAFIRFYERLYCYKPFCLFLSDLDYYPRPVLHKVNPRTGENGYLLQFMTSKYSSEDICLYLDSGLKKGHAVIWSCGCNSRDGWDAGLVDHKSPCFEIDDSCCEEPYAATHNSDMFIVADFETWLAGAISFYDASHHSMRPDEWDRKHSSGTLRKARLNQFLAANPDVSL